MNASTKSRPPGNRDTPAMRQHARFKSAHPDCVLFFRMGDFYEMFDDDALVAHRALGITLTQRSEGIPMAGVPHHAVENYLRRMIEQGYRVAVCDQIQDPKDAKGVVDRAVTRVITPGTLIDEGLLDESTTNQVAAVLVAEEATNDRPPRAAIATAELSTGTFTVLEVTTDRLLDELVRLGPSELVVAEAEDGSRSPHIERVAEQLGCSLSPRPAWTFRPRDARELLLSHYQVATLSGFGLDDDDPTIGPAGALLRYFQETQSLSDGTGPGRLRHLQPPRRQAAEAFITIDAASLRSLEIERTMRSEQRKGALLAVLQRCRTPMGKRLLRQWLCFPSRELAVIQQRQRAVSHLLDDATLRAALIESLACVQDVARIIGRISMGRATPPDVVALGGSTRGLGHIRELLEGRPPFAALHQRLGELAGELVPLAKSIGQRCVDEPPAHMREGGLFRKGHDAELDAALLLRRDADQWLVNYQGQLSSQTQIPSLKVGYNKVFGYYIEVTHVHTEKVPDHFTRKQTLKNAERYITSELKTFEDKVLTAGQRAIDREKILFEALCREVADHHPALRAFADCIAELDVLTCFAEVAQRYGYVRPTVVEEPVLHIKQGRHPVLDRTLQDRFVPNDCVLGMEDQSAARDAPATLAIITGPNMAGKSTYIRQVALIVLLAHCGCFVPADEAVIGLVDRIFTRIGASDELHTGQSTFMVEMTETANILHHATDHSLVILDEIGRGTSTLDGLSLAWAIAETIAGRRPRTLFATHYHELTSLADRLDNVTNLHVSVREWGEEVIFLYRILPGRTDRSYGIHVAKIAGVPPATIKRAAELLETLAVQTEPAMIGPTQLPPPGGQMGLFREYLAHPVIEELKTMDLNQMNPVQAFDALRRMIEEVERG